MKYKMFLLTIFLGMTTPAQAFDVFGMINTVQSIKGAMDTAEAVNTIGSMKEAHDNQGILKNYDLIMFQKSESVKDEVYIETIKMFTIQNYKGTSIFGGGKKTKTPTIGLYSYDYPTEGLTVINAFVEKRNVDGIAGIATLGQEHYLLTLKLPNTEEVLYSQDVEAPNDDTDQVAGSLVAIINQLTINKQPAQ